MTLVYSADQEGPGLHALLIGVGHYAMRDWRIRGAPQSAAMFCEWLLNRSNREALPVPLASVELLLSEHEYGGEFQEKKIDPCTTENVRRSVYAWMNLASQDQSGMTLFYCAGHGVLLDRDEQLLLLADFGEGENDYERWTGDHVVSLREIFHLMAPSILHPNIARRQIYLFDVGARSHHIIEKYQIVPRQLFARPVQIGWDDRIAPIF